MGIDDESEVGDVAGTLGEEQQRAIDELGRRAGAALRRPAPEQGLAGIERRATTQRLLRAGGAVVGIVLVVVAGIVVLGGGDDEPGRMIVTNTVPTVPETSPTTVPAPTVEAAPTTTPVTVPATASADDSAPETTLWSVASPSSIDMQLHAGSPPALMVVTDNGATVTVRNPWRWDVTTQIRPIDDDGTPLIIGSLRSTVFLTIATTDDGRIVQVDPWHGSSVLWPHPGEVTDVFAYLVLAGSDYPVMFWSAGFDEVDGQRTPVVWYNTGPVADAQGSVTGVPTATVVAVGDPGGTTPPLVTGDDTVAHALFPEPDGTSRLFNFACVAISAEGCPPDGIGTQRTDLTFREPTAMVIGGDRNLWVADANGLHVVELGTSDMKVRTVWDTPIRSLWPNFNDLDHAVLVLDDNGVVASLAGSGDAVEHYRDEAATAMLAGPFESEGKQLFLVHGDGDEVLIVDLDVFPDGGADGWSWD